jgi:hypothetical protein
MEKFPTNQIVKIGIVVRDVEAAVKEYVNLYNIPAPEIHQSPEYKQLPGGKMPGTVFRGQKGKYHIKNASIKLEPIYIELVQPLDDFGPWHEFLEKHGPGVMYMASEAASGFGEVEEMMARKGMPIYHWTEKGTQRYGYFETEEKLGITLEFKELD